jgi:hypothetical protein
MIAEAFIRAVFTANIIDRRRSAETRAAFRVLATRFIPGALGIVLAVCAFAADDIFMLFAAGFTVFGGFIDASYVPDALFGGTKASYDT